MMTCTKPEISPDAKSDDVITSGFEIVFACQNSTVIPMPLCEVPGVMDAIPYSRCPYCASKSIIVQRVERMRNPDIFSD